ncbi:MAG: hypothetical protein ABI369_08320 [Acetobacteraceae bacterium]
MRDDQPLLTYSQVREWQSRITEIAEQVGALQAESVTVARKLEAAKIIIGDLPGDKTDIAPQVSMSFAERASDPLPEVVLKAVDALGGAPKPGEIRRWITDHETAGAAQAATKPYFYTVLMRYARTGRLIKDGGGYRLPASSPQGEAGGVAPPASSIA